MYSKKKNTIFTICIIIFLAVVGYLFINKNQSASQNIDDKMTLSNKELENLDDSQREAEEKLQEEKKEYYSKMLNAIEHPEYHKSTYGRTLNKAFVADSTTFRNAYGMIEYEFLDYEELDNLTSYISGVDLENKEEMLQKGVYIDTNRLYIETGLINADGTFNRVTQVEREIQSDGTLGEEIKYEDSELTAVKIKIRYKNLSPKENRLVFSALHTLNTCTYTENDELYFRSSIYGRKLFFDTYLPIYNSLSKRFEVEDNIDGPSVITSSINLKPYEECEAEYIYIVLKEELDYMCLVSNWSEGNGEISNYKDVGSNIVFFSYLREQFDKK